jgi:hypothetical protein
MKIESLQIWSRILAAKPSTSAAIRPINILRAVIRAGGLHQAGPDESEHMDYIPREKLFSDLTRDNRRAKNDPKFCRRYRATVANRKRMKEIVMHIAARYHSTVRPLFRSEYASIKFSPGRTMVGYYSRPHNYPRQYTHAGAWWDDKHVTLSPASGRQILLPPIPKKMIKAWVATEPHPVGLFAVPVRGQTGVFACMSPSADMQRWVVSGFAVGGHLVPECVARGKIALADITAEKNAESKRIMIERFGTDKYVRESGMLPISTDDWGTLYDLGSHRVVRLVNSTTETDGTARQYFRAVPTSCATAHEAVAWTFGLEEKNYQPVVMS